MGSIRGVAYKEARRFVMLVLTRRVGERIMIGDDEVLEVRGNRVRLGMQAPRGVTILRDELVPPEAGPKKAGDPAALS
jgi:carbon storage regulator